MQRNDKSVKAGCMLLHAILSGLANGCAEILRQYDSFAALYRPGGRSLSA